ncbi:MAG: T9SS type A sorting domain-containing protein, partial [Bacteroidota bacterium]
MNTHRITILAFLILFPFLTFSQNHRLDWGISFGNLDADNLWDIARDANGNIYATGSFNGMVDFDPGPGVFNLSTNGDRECFLLKLDSLGNFIWAKQFFEISDDNRSPSEWLLVSESGEIYLAGIYGSRVDADPGPGVYNLLPSTHPTLDNSFVIKLDANGDFLWAIGAQMQIYAIALDSDENLYVCGDQFAVLDFDPGIGIADLPNAEAFIQKLDAQGNFVWVKGFGGDNHVTDLIKIVSYMHVGPQKDITFMGLFESGRADFDPGPNQYGLGPVENQKDMFVVQWDSLGDFNWANYIRSPNSEIAGAIAEDNQGNVYVSGSFAGDTDFDPNSAAGLVNGPRAIPNRNAFLLKYDENGQFQWVKDFGGTVLGRGHVAPCLLKFDPDQNIYLGGHFSSTTPSQIDFDPSAAVDVKGISRGGFVSKFNRNGDYFWSEVLPTVRYKTIGSMYLDEQANLYLGGSFIDTLDLDFSASQEILIPQRQNWTDIFIAKWNPDSCISLISALDSIQDLTCASPGFMSVYTQGGRTPYTYSWSNDPMRQDSFAIINQEGLELLRIIDSIGCEREVGAWINGPQNGSGIDFQLNMSHGVARAGFPFPIDLNVENTYCSPSTSRLRMQFDSNIRFDSASISPDSIIGNTLVWNLPALDYDAGQFRITVFTTVEVSAFFVPEVCFSAEVIPDVQGETILFNNRENSCPDVLNSYDPNDMQVSPEGICEERFTPQHENLTYKIRFQNTGNAEALNIFILDTLDTDLDLNTLRITAQSHDPMFTEILDDRVLRFRFDNINLPDSTTDEPNSHGYVIYEISPQRNLPDGSEIRNRAGIYFDFNEPIITNTVLNTLVDTLPELNTTVRQESSSLIAAEMNATYQWLDCNDGNRPIPGATERNFSPSENGNYAVRIQQGSCMVVSSCVEVLNVAIDELFQSQLKVYPNPSQGNFTVDLGKQYRNIEIQILNPLGQVMIIKEYASQQEIAINLNAQKGMYFI